MRTRSVAVIAGDGIGQEVVPAAIQCIQALLPAYSLRLDWVEYEWGSDYYLKHGRMLPVDGVDRLAKPDALPLGAAGMPGIPDPEPP